MTDPKITEHIPFKPTPEGFVMHWWDRCSGESYKGRTLKQEYQPHLLHTGIIYLLAQKHITSDDLPKLNQMLKDGIFNFPTFQLLRSGAISKERFLNLSPDDAAKINDYRLDKLLGITANTGLYLLNHDYGDPRLNFSGNARLYLKGYQRPVSNSQECLDVLLGHEGALAPLKIDKIRQIFTTHREKAPFILEHLQWLSDILESQNLQDRFEIERKLINKRVYTFNNKEYRADFYDMFEILKALQDKDRLRIANFALSLLIVDDQGTSPFAENIDTVKAFIHSDGGWDTMKALANKMHLVMETLARGDLTLDRLADSVDFLSGMTQYTCDAYIAGAMSLGEIAEFSPEVTDMLCQVFGYASSPESCVIVLNSRKNTLSGLFGEQGLTQRILWPFQRIELYWDRLEQYDSSILLHFAENEEALGVLISPDMLRLYRKDPESFRQEVQRRLGLGE